MKTVLEYLEHTAALRPQAVAVEDASGTATFRELELACRKVGSALTACIAPGEPVAVLNLRFEEQLHHAGKIAEVMELAVDGRYRGRGLGRELLERAIELAKELGCMQIELACNRLRRDAHRFYLRQGMSCYHYKFSRSLTEEGPGENRLGR